MTDASSKKRLPTSLRWTLGIGIALILSIVAFYQFARISGAKAWESAVTYYESQGGSVDFDSFLSKPIPDAENFASIPILRGITIPAGHSHPDADAGAAARATFEAARAAVLDPAFDSDPGLSPLFGAAHLSGARFDLAHWADSLTTGDPASTRPSPSVEQSDPPPAADRDRATDARTILDALDSHFGNLFAVSDPATHRPRSRWIPTPGTFIDRQVPANTPIAHGNSAVCFSQIFGIRASAAANADEPKIATDSILSILHLAAAERPSETGIIQPLIEATELSYAFAALAEALRGRILDAVALTRIQARLATFDIVKDFEIGHRADVVGMCQTLLVAKHGNQLSTFGAQVSSGIAFLPSGWVDQNRAALLTRTNDHVIAPLAARDFSEFKIQDDALKSWIREVRSSLIGPLQWALVSLTLPIYSSVGEKCAHTQSLLNQAQIACALERHFIKSGTYPDSLEALVPEFLQAVPEDPMDHKPMRYAITADGRYLLYSIGWNETDENGTPVFAGGSSNLNTKEGDWVWSYQDLRPDSENPDPE